MGAVEPSGHVVGLINETAEKEEWNTCRFLPLEENPERGGLSILHTVGMQSGRSFDEVEGGSCQAEPRVEFEYYKFRKTKTVVLSVTQT